MEQGGWSTPPCPIPAIGHTAGRFDVSRRCADKVAGILYVARSLVLRILRVGAQGRVRFGKSVLLARALAVMLCGAIPFSTQSTMVWMESKLSVAGPPEQWFMPGTRKVRAKFWVAAIPPLLAARRS